MKNRHGISKETKGFKKYILPCKKLIQHGFRGNLVQTSSLVAAQNKTCTKKMILKFVLKRSQITKHS